MNHTKWLKRASGSALALVCTLSVAAAGEAGRIGTPVKSPSLVMPGTVSTGLFERDAALSPDGKTFAFTVMLSGRRGAIVLMERRGDSWSRPEVAPFSGRWSDVEPAFSPDGKRLWFASDRPRAAGGADKKDVDLWYVERTAEGWGEPVNPGPPLNSERNEFYPSVTRDGAVYFTVGKPSKTSDEDIFVSRRAGDSFTAPENLGPAVNSDGPEFNAFIDPDERYLLYTAWGRAGDAGGGDLYVCFRKKDGTWTPARNLGPDVNSDSLDYCPSVSPDGTVLFFTSKRRTALSPGTRLTYPVLRRLQNEPGNGLGDVYQVDSGVFLRLAPAEEPHAEGSAGQSVKP